MSKHTLVATVEEGSATLNRVLHMYRAAWDSPYLPLPVRAWAPGGMEPGVLAEYLRSTFDSATIMIFRTAG